jgi:hypothetical protein
MEVYGDLQNVEDVVLPEQWDYVYHAQSGHARTGITTALLAPINIRWLLQCIAQETGRLLNREGIVVVPNNAMLTYVEQLLQGVHNLLDVAGTVRALNEQIYNHEVQEQYRGLRRRELFFKWFWFKDRPRVIEPPLDSHGRHREVPISNAEYALASPFSRFHNDFIAKQRCAINPWSP